MCPGVQVMGGAPAEALAKPVYTAVIPDAGHVGWANTISRWTMIAHARGKMLPKSPDEMLELFSKGHSLVVVDQDGNPLSHAAATAVYPDGRVEVGAVCTDPENQKKGFGKSTVSKLLDHLSQLYPGRRFFALANEDSVPLFKGLGGTEMDPSELHKDVWSACKDCLRKPTVSVDGKFKCCDTPFNLIPNQGRTEKAVIFPAPAIINGAAISVNV